MSLRPVAILTLALLGCSAQAPTAPDPGVTDGGVALIPTPVDPDRLLTGATESQARDFRAGDRAFETVFTDLDGVGPLSIRPSCAACHQHGGRGPGAVTRMALVAPGTPDPVLPLPFGPVERPVVTAGATRPILPPDGGLPPEVALLETRRVAAPLWGRALLEAVDDASIEAVAAAQSLRTDGVHGRVHRVPYRSTGSLDDGFPRHAPGDLVIGRFGVKARSAALDDFTADAFQSDLGLTTPLRPLELPNPDGLADDLVPGVDVDAATLASVVGYARLLDVPARLPAPEGGAAVFARAGCDACHVPTLRTRADWPTPQLRAIDVPLYTDVLLHDMGAALADGQTDEGAGPRDFRTAPLVGLRFLPVYLHDGRAGTLDAAIRGHAGEGSEASVAVARYLALPEADRALLIAWLGTL